MPQLYSRAVRQRHHRQLTPRTPGSLWWAAWTTWKAEMDALLVREKAHTREGDTIAAARRQLPMVG